MTRGAKADVVWSAPASCPSAEVVNARVKELSPEGVREPSANAVVDVTGARFRADVRVTTPSGSSGSRAIEGDRCEDVAEAVALVIAMSLRDEPNPNRPPEAAPAPTPPPERRRAGEPVSTSGLRVLLGAFAAAEVGSLASASVGGSVALGVSRDWFRAELGGSLYPNQTVELRPGVGGVFTHRSAVARVCVVPTFGGLQFGGCGGFGLVFLAATGVGTERISERATALPVPEVAALASYSFNRAIALRAQVVTGIQLARPTFSLDNVGDVHRPSALTVGALFGPEIRF